MTGESQPVPDDRSVERVRYELRLRLLHVVAVQSVTPHALRVTLAGDHMSSFVSNGFDDHVKLMLPAEARTFHTLPERL